jgi:hypothetical protein
MYNAAIHSLLHEVCRWFAQDHSLRSAVNYGLITTAEDVLIATPEPERSADAQTTEGHRHRP